MLYCAALGNLGFILMRVSANDEPFILLSHRAERPSLRKNPDEQEEKDMSQESILYKMQIREGDFLVLCTYEVLTCLANEDIVHIVKTALVKKDLHSISLQDIANTIALRAYNSQKKSADSLLKDHIQVYSSPHI